MPDKQRVLELVTAMPEVYTYQEILQSLKIWFSDQRAEADIEAGRYYETSAAKQRVRELAGA